MNLMAVSFNFVDILLIIVGALLAIVGIIAMIVKIILINKYRKLNKQTPGNELTGEKTARLLLDNLGMDDVRVVKAGFFSALFFGNSYSARKKMIRLRANIFNKNSITAVGIATQKVGLAILHKEGNKKFIARSHLYPFMIFAPALFIPIILIGIIIDLILTSGFGIISISAVVIALLFLAAAFVFTLLNIPVEKMANEKAMIIMEQTNFLDKEKRDKIANVYHYYIVEYVLDFVITVLQIIRIILKLLSKARRSN